MTIRRGQAGFTLVEIIVMIVLVSIAMVGVMAAYQHAMRHGADPVHQTRALKLGQAYLEEILGKRFDENTGQGGIPRCNSTDAGAQPCSSTFGPDGGETRDLYDDVDDYHGLDLSPPTDANGNALTGYNGFRLRVQVVNAGNELAGLNNADAKRIDVTVTTPRGNDFQFSGYRVNF
ncbi:MAG TPA: type II secretion system protein [Gammaproteobacteria bacterium]|nr:type II secretion system protein [Gammaproteobacteria bacterium]